GYPLAAALAGRIRNAGGTINPLPASPPPTIAYAVRSVLNDATALLAREDKAALDFLAWLAHFGPTELPTEILVPDSDGILSQRLAAILASPPESENILNAIQKVGLIARFEDSIGIHPVLQTSIREGLPEPARKAWSTAALRWI